MCGMHSMYYILLTIGYTYIHVYNMYVPYRMKIYTEFNLTSNNYNIGVLSPAGRYEGSIDD